MEEAKLQTLVQIKAFLDGTSEVAFRVPKEERNQFIEQGKIACSHLCPKRLTKLVGRCLTFDAHNLIYNNPVENAIRPIALGKMNWLFAGSEHAKKRGRP